MTRLTLRSFLDWEMNGELAKIEEATERLGLLKHWILNFEGMHPMYKNQVIRQINKEIKEKEFYNCFEPLEEVEE